MLGYNNAEYAGESAVALPMEAACVRYCGPLAGYFADT